MILAKRVEHEKRLWLAPGLAAALLVSFALPVSLTPILQLQHNVNKQLTPVFLFGWVPDFMDPSGRVQSTLSGGVVLETASGSVVRVSSDGVRQVLYRASGANLLDIVKVLPAFPGFFMPNSVAFSPDDTTWMLTQPDEERNPDLYEITVADSSGTQSI